MTRKDYIVIAAAIAEGRKFPENDVARSIASSVAWALARDNPRFDRDKFLRACGVTL